MNARLPIMATFLEALTLPYKHYRRLLKAGLPLMVTLGVFIPLHYFFPAPEGGYLELAFFGLSVIALLMSLVMGIVGCHRIFLLGDSVAEKSRLLNWTGSAINYAGWWIYIWLCVIFVCIVFVPFAIVFMWLWESAKHFFDNYPAFYFVGLPQSWWVIIGEFRPDTAAGHQDESKWHRGIVACFEIPALVSSPS